VNNPSIPSERMVENLLRTLSKDKKPYPQGLLEARRVAYLSQVTLLVGSGTLPGKGKKTRGQGHGSAAHAVAPMTPVMKAVLAVLVVGNIALAIYLGALVYQNWDKVQALLSGAPIAGETSPAPPELSTQPPVTDSTPEIVTAPESTDVPGSTSEPDTSLEEPQPAGGDSVDQPEVSTPEPTAEDKPGLHLGQTPHAPDKPPGQDKNNDQGTDKNNNQSTDKNNDQGNNKNKDKDK
jgi:hypothetical protein